MTTALRGGKVGQRSNKSEDLPDMPVGLLAALEDWSRAMNEENSVCNMVYCAL